MTAVTSTEMTGILSLRYGPAIEGQNVGRWVEARCREMPEGAYVQLTFEILDPHPSESKRKEPTDGGPDCDWCENKRWRWTHDPSLDGHGGANGGGWTWRYCHRCNRNGEINSTVPR